MPTRQHRKLAPCRGQLFMLVSSPSHHLLFC
ncbi:hypothetical protein EPYR_02581 [Erwinia pyrifoliae DSM 12163]|nr:hypothetical protein EPYR_02581 [Erwinia pyrifoliae DSM 12163]